MASFAFHGSETSPLFSSDGEKQVETLLGLKASISNDGDEATFCVSYKDRLPIFVSVLFGMMGQVAHEVRYAASLMNHRQRLKLDHGAETMHELCATALRPESVHLYVEPETADRILIFQFFESSSSPLVLRMKPDQFMAMMKDLSTTVEKSTH